MWEEVTGDSFVVDVAAVKDDERMAKYLEKYLRKGLEDRKRLEELGYARRWACSRNWPRGHALGLRGTKEGEWVSIRMVADGVGARMLSEYEQSKDSARFDCASMAQVGTDLAVELFGDRKEKALVRRVKGVLN